MLDPWGIYFYFYCPWKTFLTYTSRFYILLTSHILVILVEYIYQGLKAVSPLSLIQPSTAQCLFYIIVIRLSAPRDTSWNKYLCVISDFFPA